MRAQGKVQQPERSCGRTKERPGNRNVDFWHLGKGRNGSKSWLYGGKWASKDDEAVGLNVWENPSYSVRKRLELVGTVIQEGDLHGSEEGGLVSGNKNENWREKNLVKNIFRKGSSVR